MRKRCGDEELAEACRRVLERHPEVSSLRLLKELVSREVECAFSAKRLLRIVATSGFAGIRVVRRRGMQGGRCPLCGSEMEARRAHDLYMREVKAGMRCAVCGYSVSRTDRVPARYSFYRRLVG